MAYPQNYKPKYSLSLVYLKMIMPKKELDALIDRYITAKLENVKGTYSKTPKTAPKKREKAVIH